MAPTLKCHLLYAASIAGVNAGNFENFDPFMKYIPFKIVGLRSTLQSTWKPEPGQNVAFQIYRKSCSRGGAMVVRTTCNHTVAGSSLACVTSDFFFWQGRLVHMPMNTASRRLSVHSHLSGCVSAGNALSLFKKPK